jgi:HSP20 family protein
MALIRWKPATREVEPFRNLMGIQDEMNRLFDTMLSRWASDDKEIFGRGWAPMIDVEEDEDKVTVTAELPGLADKDIDISILGDTLTIKGEKKKEEEKKEKNYHRVERAYGAFQRSVALPTTVESDKAKASFKDGVLSVEMPKKEEAKPKQIKVKLD